MVQKFKIEHTFDHPWEKITYSSLNKYPNPHSPHVKSVDTLERNYDPISKALYTVRLISWYVCYVMLWYACCVYAM